MTNAFMLKRHPAEAGNQSSFVKKAAFIGVALQSHARSSGVGTSYNIDHKIDRCFASANAEIV